MASLLGPYAICSNYNCAWECQTGIVASEQFLKGTRWKRCEASTRIKGAIRLYDNDNGVLMGQSSCIAKLHTPNMVDLGAETVPKYRRHRFTFERLKVLGQSSQRDVRLS